MNTNAAAAGRTVSLRILLDEELHDTLAAQAMLRAQDVEELIAARLEETQEYTSENPLYLDDAAAAKVRAMLGGSINTPDKLLAKIREVITARLFFDDVDAENEVRALPEVPLSPAQIVQIGSYARTAGKSFDEMFTIIVRDAIAEKLRA